ncbi:Telomerase-binding EST1A [Fusarium coicis]|nr:Telomerase-binding EST1A [Fusarium coicis]
MGGGPRNPKDAPADCLATDSVVHHTSEVPVVTEPNGASSQSPPPDGNDVGSMENHENIKADDTEDDAATVTGCEQDSSNAVAKEVQTVKANNQDPPLDSEPVPELKKQPDTRPISQEQLVAEVKGIYAGLVMVESKCIEVDANQMPPTDGPLDITRYLLMIPESKLVLLQSSETRPHFTVQTWYIKVHKDATEGDKKPSALEWTKDSPATGEDLSTTTDTLPTASKDCAATSEATSEEASSHPHASEKITPQVGSPEDYRHGFQVALESRAKELGWPEHEEIAAATTAEIGEEGRQKVMDGKYFLAIGYELVEQILRDLEMAKERAEKKAAEAKAEQEAKAKKEAAEAKTEQDTAQAEEDNKHSNPDPETTSTSVGEMLDKTASKEAEAEEAFEEITPEEAEHASKEADLEEIAPERVEVELEEVDHEKTSPKVADANADAALDEVTVTTQPLDQDAKLSAQEPHISTVEPDADADALAEVVAAIRQHSAPNANLSGQEPQASPEEAGAAPSDSGKDMADTGVDTTALTKETKSESEKKPETELPCYVEFRQLGDQSLYKKIGSEYWVLIDSQWVPSLNAEQFAALIALHRTLLHEHYDFFLASQHPSASAALKRLAAKYAMPARMWRHGIHSFLEVMRKRLVESGEQMACFIILAYQMMSLLEETVPRFRHTWIECKADLARYGMATQSADKKALQRWHDISKEEYTRASGENPTAGHIYHHLAILARPQTRVSPDEEFEATVSQLFCYTKSLLVEDPFFAARESVLTLIKPIVDRNEKEAEKPASVPQTDKDHFLTAVSHLILASLEPETLRKNGYNDSRNEHVQAVYAALEKINICASSKTSRICPSPQLGLLLCQLLLGIPLVDQRCSPMMAAWAEDRVDSDAMANARDIHDVTIELIRTMVPYLLEEADTRDLRLWGFIYVMLVFMRSLKTRPGLLEWFGSAFHAQLLAPFLNMLLREDEARGGLALGSASQSELVTICSLLNEDKRLDKYGLSTEDSLRNYLREQEEQRKAELVKSEAEAKDATATPEEVTVATDDNTITSVETTSTSTAEEATVTTEPTVVTPEGSQTTAEEDKVPREESTAATEETTTSDAAHEKDLDTKTPDWKLVYANTLPEHSLLTGFFFAREAEPEPRDKSLEKPAEDAVAVACPAAPDATPAAVQTVEESVVQSTEEPAAETVEEPAVEQPQGVSLTDSKTDSKAEDEFLTDSDSENGEEYEILAVSESNNESQGGEQTKPEAMEASLVEVKREENENENVQQQDSQTKEVEAEKTQEEDKQKAREAEEARVAEEEKEREAKEAEEARLAEEERKKREAKEAEEAEVRRQEGLRRDPPLFPHGWFKRSKYDYDEIQVRNYVQDAETCDARSNQLLRLAAQLTGDFFVFETDEEGRYWISVPGASSVPKPDPNKKMPEIIERDGGVRVVYVHPSFHTAEIERQKRTAAREEKRQNEAERQKEKKRKEEEAKATTDVATAVNEKAEGDAEEVSVANNVPEASQPTDTTEQQPTQSEKPVSQVDVEEAPEAVNVPAVAPSTVSEDGDHEPSSAYEMDLDKAIGLEKATVAAEKPPVTHEAEPTEAEPTEAKVEMTLPVRGVDDAQETKGSDAGPDAAAATTTAPAADAATDPQITVPLTEDVLDNMPNMENPTKAIKRWRAASKGPGADEGTDEDEDEDEKEWERLSNESHGEAKVETRSMFSRLFFG